MKICRLGGKNSVVKGLKRWLENSEHAGGGGGGGEGLKCMIMINWTYIRIIPHAVLGILSVPNFIRGQFSVQLHVGGNLIQY